MSPDAAHRSRSRHSSARLPGRASAVTPYRLGPHWDGPARPECTPMPDDRRPWTDPPSADAPADGVLVFNGRVAATGTTAAAEAALGPAARRIDLQGGVAIPGLVDCHPHLLHLATRAAGYVDLGDARSHDDVVQRFRERNRREMCRAVARRFARGLRVERLQDLLRRDRHLVDAHADRIVNRVRDRGHHREQRPLADLLRAERPAWIRVLHQLGEHLRHVERRRALVFQHRREFVHERVRQLRR